MIHDCESEVVDSFYWSCEEACRVAVGLSNIGDGFSEDQVAIHLYVYSNHTQRHTHTHRHTHTYRQTHTHKHTHTHIQTDTHTRTYKHTHTHIQTHTHT